MKETGNLYSDGKDEKQVREERVRIVLGMTAQLDTKLKSLGIKRKSALIATADLGDIYLYADDVRKYLELLLETPSSDLRKLGEICVDLRITLGEIKDHILDARIPLEYMAEYCYKLAGE